MVRVGEKNTVGGLYRCSRCKSLRTIAAQEFFPACLDCNSLGKGWIFVGTSSDTSTRSAIYPDVTMG